MKKNWLPTKLGLFLGFGVMSFASLAFAESPVMPNVLTPDEPIVTPTPPSDKYSYGLGLLLSRDVGNIKASLGQEIDIEVLVNGMRDGFHQKPSMSIEEAQTLWVELRQKAVAKKASEKQNIATQNLDVGKAYLAENGERKAVKTTKSGLQYEVIKPGKGKSPKGSNTVSVKYVGKLIDGTEFDRSPEGETVSFPLDAVIAGWTEGLQLMKEGGEYIFYIPANLGYGERGSGEVIPPNSVLVFNVELVKVN